jgi:hypothetical protein
MKKIQFVLLLTLLAFAPEAFAQYGQPYNPGGVDRRIDTQRRAPDTYNKNAKDKADIVDVTVEQLNKKLKLDDFQKAAITNIYKDNKDKILAIADEDIPLAAKKDKSREIMEKIDKQILVLLNKEQTKTYNEMIEERNKL